ncbi:Peptidase S41 [Pacmanvirus A23]|uniref:Peptidase S41 n=1 Tax=Pacmanvirus A23 TaxID=1932881 RepID=UPI000A094358|nr:Peptidase S41 [Pacmanvirus A23]SIP85943.1 Peptidase S41 [Pacmanvirus A23]
MDRLESLKNIIESIRLLYVDAELAEKVASGIEDYIKNPIGSARIALNDSTEYIFEINSIINYITNDLHFHISKHQQSYSGQPSVLRYTPHYVKLVGLNYFYNENVRNELIHIFDQLQDPVILDLRDCRGGDAETVLFILSHFFDDGTPLMEIHSRLNPVLSIKAVSVIKGFDRANEVKKYKGRVKVLVNNLTFSGGEIIAKILQVHGRAKIYGTPTVGMFNLTSTRVFGELELHIPDAKIIDVFSKEDYDKKGVMPDFNPISKEYIQTVFSEMFVDTFGVYQ